MIENIVIGRPLVDARYLFALNDKDWDKNESKKTLFTNETFLPKILVAAGIYKSTSEVRRNRPDLVINLDKIDFIDKLKVAKKKFIWIARGEL